jgi:hypothetical protein
MGLWWVGNVIFLAAVIPVVVLLLHRLLQPVVAISTASDKILAGGTHVASELGNVPKLVTTRDLITQVGGAVGRYGTALDTIL